ncbi:MAG: PAC2 family protein [Candidatus Lokiarchaeota archaeon]|nr:PAC2 family protein [Candidatus Lokiarchaeota archaeon]
MKIDFEKKIEITKEDINNPIVLIGWPGIALVGKLAISSIKDSIGAELLYNIKYFDFPPKSFVEKGFLDIPTAKLYYKKRESGDIFILTGDYQPQTPAGVFDFSQKFCEKMKEITDNKIKMYISTGAMVSDKIIEKKVPDIYVCGTDKEIVNSFLEHENTLLMENGVIAGANGILPAWAGNNNFGPGICLLAETLPIQMINVDPKASKALVTLLKDYFKLDMDYSELDKQIKEMEEMLEKFNEQANYFPQGIPPKKEHEDSYFR